VGRNKIPAPKCSSFGLRLDELRIFMPIGTTDDF